MNEPGWDDVGLSRKRVARWALRLREDLCARGSLDSRPRELLAWGRRYLPHYFRRPPSVMHVWLADELDRLLDERGQKINVIGPRGGAKSTLVTLAHVLRAALERRELYIWIVSDTWQQARSHLDNVKLEIQDNQALRRAFPSSCRRGRFWRSGAIALANEVVIEAYGAGQRLRGRRRRASRPTLIVCDDLQNDGHMQSARQRELTEQWFHGTLMKAGTKQTNVIHLATALHRQGLALVLHRVAGWNSRIFPAIERWPDNMELWSQWEAIYRDVENPRAREKAREFYRRHAPAMEAGAELLWGEEEDLYTLMCQRAEGGHMSFEREKQGCPLAPQDCEWPEEYFGDEIWFGEWPPDRLATTMALDPSKGRDARRGDFSAYVLLLVDRQGKLYVEADMARRPAPLDLGESRAEASPHSPPGTLFGVETAAVQG